MQQKVILKDSQLSPNGFSYLQNGSCVHSCANGFQPYHVNYSTQFVFQQCQHCGDSMYHIFDINFYIVQGGRVTTYNFLLLY